MSLANVAGTCFLDSVELHTRAGPDNVSEAPGKKRREFLVIEYLTSENYIVPGIDEGVRDFYRVFHLGSGTVGLMAFWEDDKCDLEILHSRNEEIRNRWPQEGSTRPKYLVDWNPVRSSSLSRP